MPVITRLHYFIRLSLDLIVLVVAFSFARTYLSNDIFQVFDKNSILILLGSLITWYFIAKVVVLYDELKNRPFSHELVAVIKSVMAHTIVFAVVLFFFFNHNLYPRIFFVIHGTTLLLLLSLQKYLVRIAAAKVRKENNGESKVVIVGAGNLGLNFYKNVIEDHWYRYKMVGFVDDEKKSFLNGQYLGTIDELDYILSTKEVEEVIIALPNTAISRIERAIMASEKNGKRVKLIPDYYRFGSGNLKVMNFGNFSLIAVRPLPLDDAENRLFKRIFDIFFSILFMVFVFSWLFPVIAIIIKLTSKGPVLFKQERWGLNNKKIICYKFRSMLVASTDIDENGKYKQAKKNDPRITGIGKVLRKTSIDELPQVWNVFIGNMSFVGPRPHPIPLNMESKDVVEHYMLRHWVKPGITGWAQVNGSRGETKTIGQMQKRIDFDLWYIENWTTWLDFQIIFQTIINMIKNSENVY